MRNVGVELKTLNNALLRRLRRLAGDAGGEITGTNGWIIAFLAENSDRDVYQSEIEREFSITKSTASRVIALMERKGLIEKRSDGADARRRIIRLAARSREVEKELQSANERIGERLVNGFSEEEIEQLSNFIERMKRNITSEDA